ncbi:MAG: kelch repeat-containing protein [Planctomycetes bacterium]|nr:kelch repeat-containing protein [Planctomycetota bacterium]
MVRRTLASALLVACAAIANGGEHLNPLAKLPSPPGEHIAKIKALGDNAWLDLGKPAPDPKWGGSRGRSWCPGLEYAPDLRGAFHTGEGVHAFIKPDGHYMDDYFVYDINAHAWICIYPGTVAGEDQGLKVTDDGLFAGADGLLVPPGLLAHEYDQAAYDSDQKKFAFIPKGLSTGWWITMKCAQLKALAGDANSKMKGKAFSPWYYDTKTAKFEREVVKGKGPLTTIGAGNFVYLPVVKKFWLRDTSNAKNWLYDTAAKTWAEAADFPERPLGGEPLSCYDSKRGMLYIAGGNEQPAADGLLAYDPKADTWTELKTIPRAERATHNSASMTYDSANDVVVLSLHDRGTLVYDVAAAKWTIEKPLPAPEGWRKATTGAFYDPENNAHYYFQAGDSKDDGTMWVYRYKRAEEPGAPAEK